MPVRPGAPGASPVRARRVALGGYLRGALLALLLALTACTLPGQLQPDPTATATPPPMATAMAPPATNTPAAARATPTAVQARAGAATPRPATPATPAARVAPTPTTGRGSPTPRRATPAAGARATPVPFTATNEEPCREADYDTAPLPERPASVRTVEHAYRCILQHYVDRKTLDHRILLNGAWEQLVAAGRGVFTAQESAPLALVDDREADWQVYADRYNALVRKYSAVDPSLVARIAIDGMARSLNDNHTAYLEPQLWQRAHLEATGSDTQIGPGFDLAVEEPTGTFYLYDVHPDSPAARAGLKRGDVIEQAGGRPARRGSPNQGLYDLLTGPVGTTVTLQLSRPATGQTINARVSVAETKLAPLEWRLLPTAGGNIGYIRLRSFTINAGEEFDQALAALQEQGISGLIFDVRQNGGGFVSQLRHITSHFSHQNPLSITIDEDGKREEEPFDETVPLLTIPWVVLADGGSASSSDVTAAVAKDRGGHLVGQKTSGGLGGAIFYELEDGSGLEITVVRVLGPDGEEINEIGVEPHHAVTLTPLDLSSDWDPQLAHAIADLGGQ